MARKRVQCPKTYQDQAEGQCQNHKAALNYEKCPTVPALHKDSSFVLHFLNFKDKGNFAVYDQDCQNVLTPH